MRSGTTGDQRAGSAGKPVRAAIYCRTAVGGRGDATGRDPRLAAQEAACRAYAGERGWDVVAVHAEVAPGTAAADRPALARLRAAVQRGEVDALLVHRLDRLGRDRDEVGRLLADVEGAGVRWASVAEGGDDAPAGRVLRALFGGGATVGVAAEGQR